MTRRDKTDRLARGQDRVLQCLAACLCPVPPLLLQTCWLEMRYKVACFSVCEIAASWMAGCLNQSFLEYSVSASVLVFALTGNTNASCSYRQPASFSGSRSLHLSCCGLEEPLQCRNFRSKVPCLRASAITELTKLFFFLSLH